jgi:hypothetical protein
MGWEITFRSVTPTPIQVKTISEARFGKARFDKVRFDKLVDGKVASK